MIAKIHPGSAQDFGIAASMGTHRSVDRHGELVMNYADELYGFVRRHQRMPTFRELMTLWNYKTKSAVDYRVKKLLAAGLIEKEGRRLLAKRSGLALARSADPDEPAAANRS